MTVVAIPFGELSDLNRTFTGWSDPPIAVDDQIIEAKARLKEAASSQPMILALSGLSSVQNEYSVENWDGFGALPVSEGAVSEATIFLKLLNNTNLPMPQISPEVDGGIEFEWYLPSNQIFTISFNGRNVLGYSGMFGKEDTFYGTSKIDSKIPDIVRWNISKFTQK
ncbi:MAG: hypothetical protein IIA60_01185 [Candidatus Marinimicrobia bacterium]|nr:hypothetical protein [Candidatus Neomarinimicrobiota bacterium]